MKKTLALCCMLLLPNQLTAAETSAGSLAWSVMESWKTDAKPVDFAQSLDGSTVFILGDDGKVHLYSFSGEKRGVVPVDKSTVAIDIAPRGEMLYLVDSNGGYKSVDISFVQDIDISGKGSMAKKHSQESDNKMQLKLF